MSIRSSVISLAGVAANVCGVTVAVIAEVQPAPFDCDAAVTQDLPVAFRR